MNFPVLVYTCTEYHHLLPAFSALFNTFWSEQQEVCWAGGPKDVNLPPNFRWYPVQSRVAFRWSDGLLEFLGMRNDPVVCLMLEDYWLCRAADAYALPSLADYVAQRPDVLKLDLTTDRLHSGHARDVDYWGHCDIIETDWETPYQLSLQAALWSRKNLLDILRPEMSPWDFELSDMRPPYRVLGQRQAILRYVNAGGMGLPKNEYRTEHVREGLGGVTIDRIPDEHLAMVRRLMPGHMTENNSVNV